MSFTLMFASYPVIINLLLGSKTKNIGNLGNGGCGDFLDQYHFKIRRFMTKCLFESQFLIVSIVKQNKNSIKHNGFKLNDLY